MPGRRFVILGSGDIGLIMARRLTFSGAKVEAVVELMPYSSGLKRNIVQCLEDFGIPLLLSHTVTNIHGEGRLTGVTVNKVDDNLHPIPGTEQLFHCDSLLLSVGLIPENELSSQAGVQLDATTGGPLVDNFLQTNIPGIFACGNVLHVHDLVDDVSVQAAAAGQQAALYAAAATQSDTVTTAAPPESPISVHDGAGIRGVVPRLIHRQALLSSPIKLMFRPTRLFKDASLILEADGKIIRKTKRRVLAPGEMATFTLQPDYFADSPPVKELVLRCEAANENNH